MTENAFGSLLHAFVVDDKFKIILILIAIDVVLGVCAAFKTSTFRLSYLAEFAKDDLLGKVVPWFVLYSGAILAGGASIAGVDLGDIAGTLYALIVAAMVGSIFGSLRQLGLPVNVKGLT